LRDIFRQRVDGMRRPGPGDEQRMSQQQRQARRALPDEFATGFDTDRPIQYDQWTVYLQYITDGGVERFWSWLG
jgi:hypothetical protein